MSEQAVLIFENLRHIGDSPEGKVIYILAVICVLMILDFLTGTVAAWRSTDIEFRSQEGINGILRKLLSIIVLVACIPVAALVPADLGIAALYVLYGGYLLMEFRSILENLGKLGVEISPLTGFVDKIEEEITRRAEEKKEDE
ncbi:MAG: phage holin family protein [Peptococcaceae bacterium]|nr:phage holin family protein [Peptococcaceae bacterium]